MAVMLSKTYDAFVAAGAPEDKARAAAEELAGSKVPVRQNRDGSRGPQVDARVVIAGVASLIIKAFA